MAGITTGAEGGGCSSPLLVVHATCPICGLATEQFKIKTSLFNERDRDVDMRPRRYEWTAKGFQDYHPPLYYIWWCPQCFFAADYRLFENPFQECRVSITGFKKILSEAGKNPVRQPAFRFLSRNMQALPRSFEKGLRLYFLAVYDLELSEDAVTRESMSLGRYYLRLAWLFRDLEEAELGNIDTRTVDDMLGQLGKAWPTAATDENECLERAVLYYENALQKSGAIETVRDEVELVLLISRILMKLGDVPKARAFLQTSREKMRHFEEKQRQRLRDGHGPSDEERFRMGAEGRKMRMLQEDVQTIFEDIRNEWEEKQVAEAKSLIAVHPGKKKEELMQILIDNGIERSVATKLLSSDEKKEKKKGFLGMFK